MSEAETQRIARLLGAGQGQEGHHVHLAVPEVVALVTVPGQALRGNARTIGSGSRLCELEDAPPDRLLNSRGGTHRDIAVFPERRQPLALRLVVAVEAAFADSVKCAPHPVAEFTHGHASRGVIGDSLRDHNRLALFGRDPVDLPALILGRVVQLGVHIAGFDPMIGADGQRHSRIRDPISQDHPTRAVPAHLRSQHPMIKPRVLARIRIRTCGLTTCVIVEIFFVDDLGRNDDRRIAFQQPNLVGHQRQVTLGEAHHPGRTDLHPFARRCAPDQFAAQHPLTEIDPPLIGLQIGNAQQQRLIVHVEADHQ
ncbi:hypothetical protein SDC9_111903 [bioreactor metagenome]|uniref:Uncharacterized protein n=1 Tax=bioreactor metagenome TaxID=1076179 RepID=A0A645BKE8_9ZZZZ